MKKLWIAFAVLATLGSLYPFNFEPAQLDAAKMRELIQSCCTAPGRGDVLGNILLFAPFGFFGMFAFRPDASPGRRFASLGLIALIFAAALQLAQIYLPSRNESLQDVAWNLIGTAAGAMLATVADRHRPTSKNGVIDLDIAPLALVATWLAYRLMPFVPSVDFQLIKDSLKPLLDFDITLVEIAPKVAAWLTIGYLLRVMNASARLDRFLPALILAVFILEIFIVDNVLFTADVFAALLAVAVWPLLLRSSLPPETPLAVLLLTGVTLTGLSPYTFSATNVEFNWLPFHGFLGGSMYLNALSAAQKVFVFGSIVFLLRRLSLSYAISVGLVFIVVFVIEFAQTRLPGHTPEITDPVLVIFAALALATLSEQSMRPREALSKPARRNTGAPKRPALQNRQWVTQTINLKEEQFRFVEALANEMDASVSRTTRRILENFIAENDWREGSLVETRSNQSELLDNSMSVKWNQVKVNLRRKQFQWLISASETMDTSVSRVARRIVAHFIAELEEKPAIGSERSSSTKTKE